MIGMHTTADPEPGPPAARPRLSVVVDQAHPLELISAPRFAETVRTVVTVSRRRGLRPPVFRSPPRLEGVDRSIRRGPNGTVVVAVRRGDRPLGAVQADIIEGVVAANHLDGESADRFRRAAWAALEGAGAPRPPRATMDRVPPARVA
jgi:hypothetical protein